MTKSSIVTEEEVRSWTREELTAMTSPELDAMRAEIPTLPTSKLLELVTHPEALMKIFPETEGNTPLNKLMGSLVGPAFDRQRVKLMGAAVMAIANEIDRRIPIPPPPMWTCATCGSPRRHGEPIPSCPNSRSAGLCHPKEP